ncbi:hypothetical protein [Sphingomonas sp. CFBP 8760]|nr:hypothetical protein [Sphingomonas sp. CFBP 8760]MBD8545634.1 hypothetical protein [Sphingomonas sp. CFBP 8760]
MSPTGRTIPATDATLSRHADAVVATGRISTQAMAGGCPVNDGGHTP